MCSCEYLDVGSQDRKTRPIRAKDIVFRDGARVIPHHSTRLHQAQSVSVTFGDQKSEKKDKTVTQDRTDNPELDPIDLWADLIKRL